MSRLWVVLPAFNEGPKLAGLVREVCEAGAERQVLVVDDGSTDGSGEAVAAEGLPGVRVLRHPANRGLGAALMTGFQTVLKEGGPGDLVVVLDSDGTHPVSLMEPMRDRLDERRADVVIASRYQPGARVQGLTPFRLLLSIGSSWIFRLLVPIPAVRDYTCGYRMYRLSVLRRAWERFGQELITNTGFTCMAELLVKLAVLGGRFAEVPLVLRYDQKFTASKMKVAQTVFRTLRLLGMAFLWRWFPPRGVGGTAS